MVDDATLTLEPWSPLFVLSLERLPQTVLWMRLPNLPSVCWTQSSLELIVAAAGRFVKMDDSTSLLAKGRFARVAVEVDTGVPLVPGTDVVLEGLDLPVFWQRFEFEHIHLFCGRCGCVGHRPPNCLSSPANQSFGTPHFSSSSHSDVAMTPVEAIGVDEMPVPRAWIRVRGRRRRFRQSANVGSQFRTQANSGVPSAGQQFPLLPTPSRTPSPSFATVRRILAPAADALVPAIDKIAPSRLPAGDPSLSLTGLASSHMSPVSLNELPVSSSGGTRTDKYQASGARGNLSFSKQSLQLLLWRPLKATICLGLLGL